MTLKIIRRFYLYIPSYLFSISFTKESLHIYRDYAICRGKAKVVDSSNTYIL